MLLPFIFQLQMMDAIFYDIFSLLQTPFLSERKEINL